MLPWDDSPGKNLVEMARSKFKEAEGASEQPDAIEYLSVHCDILLLILSSPSEAQKVPVPGCVWIFPNCQHNLEFLVGTLAS